MDWQEGEKSGMVECGGDVSLFLRSYGPKRETPGTPAVIIVHGLGGTYLEWLPTMKLLSQFTRAYVFERAGYHPCERSSRLRTPSNIMAELKEMLSLQGIGPPYILVGHSYGGILVRQFLADHGSEDIAGVVLVDSILDLDPNFPTDWATLLGDTPYGDVVGLAKNHCFATEEDYQEVQRTSDRNEGPGSVEEEEMENRQAQELIARLHGKQVMGSKKPLSVIVCNMANDFRKIYEHGEKHGHGSPGAREGLRKYLEHMSEKVEADMRTHLDLSGNSRFVRATGKAATHNCQMVDPDFVVEEIKWVFRQCIDAKTSIEHA